MIKLHMQNRFLRTLLLLSTIGVFAAGCEAPTDLPVDSGRASYGALASSDLSQYYYTHRAGVAYVYSNKLTTTVGSTSSTVTGSNDTVRTLGFQAIHQADSVFAISITYQVAQGQAGRGVNPLRYLPSSSSFGGAYIDGETPLQGEATTYSLATRATSTDSTTAPTYGRMRSLASDFAGSGTTIWQTDTIYYVSNASRVTLYARSPNGGFMRSKDLFRADVAVATGNEWSYSYWQTATKLKVVSENEQITVGSSNLNAIHARIDNTSLNAGSSSEKFFAPGYGQVRQVEKWSSTTDGTNSITYTLTRDGVVILDLDEILSM